MTDEHLMRQWADAHNEFSSDLDRGLLRLGHFVSARLHATSKPIGKPYASASAACTGAPADEPMSVTARAALAGVLACVATSALLASVALLATADLHPAAAQPVIAHAIVA
ncbi:MAG TPA: hypothetical protein VLM18_06780 [Croceibacterium sp.]|nr:hypothetical protein [Croceibacterium sp.]